jgi:hypothetical protein
VGPDIGVDRSRGRGCERLGAADVLVEEALDIFAAGMRFHPEGEIVLCDGSDTE